jgi:hypothetical protein
MHAGFRLRHTTSLHISGTNSQDIRLGQRRSGLGVYCVVGSNGMVEKRVPRILELVELGDRNCGVNGFRGNCTAIISATDREAL